MLEKIKGFNLTTNEIAIIIFAVIVCIVVLYIVFTKFFKEKKTKGLYSRRTFLTQNEKDCFIYLRKMFPEYHICPQVSMGAVLEPNIKSKTKNKSAKERSEYTVLRNKVQSKVIDFVMMNSDLNVEFIIELDDKSHDSKVEVDKIRDLHVLGAGIKTVRFRRENGKFPSRKDILAKISS